MYRVFCSALGGKGRMESSYGRLGLEVIEDFQNALE